MGNSTRPCGWPLPHRDKHPCSCTCRLPASHDSRQHRCEQQATVGARP